MEVDETFSVSKVKELIQETQSLEKEQQKLILKGKILADETKVSEMQYSEKDFIVVMVTKPKSTPSATSTPVKQPQAPKTAPAPEPASTQPAETENVQMTFNDSTLATGAEMQTAIANMVEMGFPESQVRLAMRAAFNNPDRAVEYLMTVLFY